MEKNDSKNVDSKNALSQLRENASKRIAEESVQAFKALADASALAFTSCKNAPAELRESQFAFAFARVKEAFASLRSLSQEANAARSLERTQRRASRFGIDIDFR